MLLKWAASFFGGTMISEVAFAGISDTIKSESLAIATAGSKMQRKDMRKMIEPDKVREAAEKKEEENWMFRTFLKMCADEKELDKQFKRLHEEIFSQYDCSKCRNCCREYTIEIPKKDLEKIAKELEMPKSLVIRTFLKKNPENGNYQTKGKPCAFLNQEGVCILGHCQPESCKGYPFTNQPGRMGSLMDIVNNTAICPVVFEIYERLKTEYGFSDTDKMSKSSKRSLLKSAKAYVDFYGLEPLSAAGMEYALYKVPGFKQELEEATEGLFAETEESKAVENMIREAKTTDEFFKLMRKPLKRSNQREFRKRLLENEENLIDFIKEKALRSMQDGFIENALYFFLHAKANCCNWILTEYENVRSAYMQSMLCLVLGARGDIAVVPFLQKEAMRFMTEDFDEKGFLEQGPLYGLHEFVLRLEK